MAALPKRIHKRLPRRLPRSLGFKKYALQFDGVDDYVEVSDSPELNIREEITLIVCVKYAALPSSTSTAWECILGKPGYWEITTYGEHDAVNPYIDDETGTRHHVGEILRGSDLLRWNTIAMTYSYNEGKQRVYVNGELVTELTWKALIEDSVGANVLIRGKCHPKYVAFVHLYNRALSQAEIRHNIMEYHNPVRDGLVLWLHDRIVGDTWYDESPYANNGTIYGAVREELAMWEIRAELGL